MQIISEPLPSLSASKPARRFNYVTAAVFVVIYGGAVCSLWLVSPRALLLAFILHFVLGIGTALGFHRLHTHRSFKTHRWVERTLAVMGTLNMQRGVVEWVAIHRMHHAQTDTPGDPHSAAEGFFHSYMGWLLWQKTRCYEPERLRRFSRDIAADPFMVFISRHEVVIAMTVAWFTLLYLSFDLSVALWCVCARLAAQHQTTFLVNGVCHRFGYRNFETPDQSTNSWFMSVVSLGEGWHNNHHFDPEAASAGRFPGEIDILYQIILGMRWLGLAWDVKEPKVVLAPKHLAGDASQVLHFRG